MRGSHHHRITEGKVKTNTSMVILGEGKKGLDGRVECSENFTNFVVDSIFHFSVGPRDSPSSAVIVEGTILRMNVNDRIR